MPQWKDKRKGQAEYTYIGARRTQLSIRKVCYESNPVLLKLKLVCKIRVIMKYANIFVFIALFINVIIVPETVYVEMFTLNYINSGTTRPLELPEC